MANMHLPAGEVTPSTQGDSVLRARYRRPRDVIWLIAGVLLLLVVLGAAAVAPDELLGRRATIVRGVEPDTAAGGLLAGLVQLFAVLTPVVAVGALLWCRRFRLLASLVGAAVVAAAGWTALIRLGSSDRPAGLVANRGSAAWLFTAGFPGPAVLAAAVAVTLVAGSWLSLSWRRATWVVVGLIAAAQLVAGVVLVMELLLAFAVGAVVGAGVLVAFGAPDRRIGPAGIAAALSGAGIPVLSVRPAGVQGNGSRQFVASQDGGQRLFVKVLGRDQRHADLLYRSYRLVRLRGVGDAPPAASLKQAVEHQALVGLVAERGGVRVPRVHRIAEAADGSVLLTMQLITGQSVQDGRVEALTDELLRELWEQVQCLHLAGVAHRSLRAANVMVDEFGRPWIVDFSFSELVATDRQLALDRAELLASTASLVGPDRAVGSAAAVIGDTDLAAAVPLLQPLALSRGTRRAVSQERNLLSRTRAAAAAASSARPSELPRLQRVRPRTLLMIAAAAGAFYFILPQLAQVGSSWRAFQSANWAWVPVIVVLSSLTYLAGGIAVTGAVTQRLPFGPTVLTQLASSFVNRVSPANVGGMALNVRYLQKCGIDPGNAVAAVGLNTSAGGVMHAVLLVVFFAWSGTALTGAFPLPSASKLLLALAVLAAIIGALLATRWGRRTVLTPVVGGIRAAAGEFRQIAGDPAKLARLVGGSLGVTLLYIAALAAAVWAFDDTVSFAKIGAVYLASSVIAAAAPTPGGLGPLEAALVAGLTAVGMAPGPAVSAVLTYRLATYWLPVLPGWLSWNLLQRWNYV
jgi:glycosyltransferase 2 family protein